MANGSLHVSWCRALVCALALVAADGLLVDITYVETAPAVAKGAGEHSSASSPIPSFPLRSRPPVRIEAFSCLTCLLLIVCLDGSAPAYHLARGSGSGVNSWLVHFEVRLLRGAVYL